MALAMIGEIFIGLLNNLPVLNYLFNILRTIIQSIGEFFKSKPVDPSPLMDKEWREIDWNTKDQIKDGLRELKIKNSNVGALHLLVFGPEGAGKSSFINSIASIFEDQKANVAETDNPPDTSFNKMFKTYTIKDNCGDNLPFIISDRMGVEKGFNMGMNSQDLMKVLEGRIAVHVHSQEDEIHCLVSVIAATTVNMMDSEIFQKMKITRLFAKKKGIPHVVVLTKVDKVCEENNIGLVYRSRKIREQMEVCSNRLGVPMTHIFPVKNYHEENHLNNDIDVLLLHALADILNIANNAWNMTGSQHNSAQPDSTVYTLNLSDCKFHGPVHIRTQPISAHSGSTVYKLDVTGCNFHGPFKSGNFSGSQHNSAQPGSTVYTLNLRDCNFHGPADIDIVPAAHPGLGRSLILQACSSSSPEQGKKRKKKKSQKSKYS